jgi:hypothetical protein
MIDPCAILPNLAEYQAFHRAGIGNSEWHRRIWF